MFIVREKKGVVGIRERVGKDGDKEWKVSGGGVNREV